jgi:phosphate/sulfate permease
MKLILVVLLWMVCCASVGFVVGYIVGCERILDEWGQAIDEIDEGKALRDRPPGAG